MFKASIDIDLLKDSIAALSVIVDEVRLNVSPTGVSVKAVDPANVAMVIYDLKSSAFEKFEADEMELGLDLIKLTDILGIVEKGSLVDIELDPETQKLKLNFNSLSYTISLLDPSTIRTEPRVPQLELPAKVVLTGQDLRKGVKAAEKISDHITLGVSDNLFYMEAKGDTDFVRLDMGANDLIHLESGDACSLFSIEYLSDIIKPAGKANEVCLSIGRDFPILIHFEIAGGKGTVTFLLAPRIESD